MAKKNKGKVELHDLELTPIVVGEISSKKSGVIAAIFMFIIFILVVIFLPQITDFIENDMRFEKSNKELNQSSELNNEENTEDLYLEEVETEIEDEYSNVNLINNTLTCTLNNEKYIYTFLDDSLTKVKYEIYVNSSDELYNEILTEYTNKNNELTNQSGVNSNVIANNLGFTYFEEYDLNIFSGVLSDINLYSIKTEANIINYEIEARGYDCN